ncbi:MAG: hypothetical protein QXE42_01230 [Candidatus Aenigmatarchaeota archaeon]
MRKKVKSRKGIARTWLIGLIILALSAGIIFFFLTKLQFQSLSEKEACKQSVIMRSEFFQKAAETVGAELVPLQCKTQLISIKTTDEEEIKRIIANAMYDCWDMLGEGKLDFTGTLLLEGPVMRCIICSKITFDDEVKKKLAGKEIEIYDYLLTTIIPGKNITYAQYLLGKESAEIQIKTAEMPKINPSLDYAIIYQEIKGVEKREVVIDVFLGMVAGASVGAVAGGIGAIPGGIIGAMGGALLGASVGVNVANIVTLGDAIYSAIKGCIAERCPGLFLVPYTSEGIGKTCERIESIP